MKVDKDLPSTWKRHRPGMCQGCRAGCCTMPVEVKSEDLIRLGLLDDADMADKSSLRKASRRLLKERKIESYREGTGLFTLARRPNGDCGFLDPKSRLCTVYETRPFVCREFPLIGPRPGFCPAQYGL